MKKKKIPLSLSIITFLIVAHFIWLQYSIYITYPATVLGFDNNQTLNDVITLKGVFGDLLSGHAALLAFIWFIYGVTLQKKEFDILVNEHHAQSNIYETQNQILISQWIDQWITNILNNFKSEIKEEKDNFYKLISTQKEEIYVSSFKKQIDLIREKKYLLANKGSELLILKYLCTIKEIKNTIRVKLTDKDLNHIFSSRVKNDFNFIEQQLMTYLLIYIASQLLLRKYNNEICIDSKYDNLVNKLNKDYFNSDMTDMLEYKYKKLIDDLIDGKINLSNYVFDNINHTLIFCEST